MIDLDHCRIWIIDRFGTLSQKWSKSRNDPKPTMIQIRQWSKSIAIDQYTAERFKQDMSDITATEVAEAILKGETWRCLITEIVDGTCRAAEYVAEHMATLEREKLLDALLDTSGEGKRVYFSMR